MKNALQTTPLASPADARLVRRLEREYNRAIRAEEDAPTEHQAYRLATLSERCLRRLQAARAGLPMPEVRMPRTARNLARGGFEALAMIGRVIGRALRTEAALRKAQVAAALLRAARKVARLARQAARRAVRVVALRALLIASVFTVVTTKENSMIAPKLASCIYVTGTNEVGVAHPNPAKGELLRYDIDIGPGVQFCRMRVKLRGEYFVFTGGLQGEHSIAADASITNVARLVAHWDGYVKNNIRYATTGSYMVGGAS